MPCRMSAISAWATSPQRLAGFAFDQRLQAAHGVVVEFFVHGGLGRGAAVFVGGGKNLFRF